MTTPTDQVANLTLRVRRPLDDRLVDLLHELRRDGIRSTKTELIELYLWELPAQLTPELRERLAAFRQRAPREAPLWP
jgi:hypothetical protein